MAPVAATAGYAWRAAGAVTWLPQPFFRVTQESMTKRQSAPFLGPRAMHVLCVHHRIEPKNAPGCEWPGTGLYPVKHELQWFACPRGQIR